MFTTNSAIFVFIIRLMLSTVDKDIKSNIFYSLFSHTFHKILNISKN